MDGPTQRLVPLFASTGAAARRGNVYGRSAVLLIRNPGGSCGIQNGGN